jgi:hypothetical protein
MAGMKMTVVFERELLEELRHRVPPRRRSPFIAAVVRRELKALRDAELARAYQAAYSEAKAEDAQLDGVAGDGLDS